MDGTHARKVGVYLERDRSARYVGGSPGETQDARKVGVSPGEMISARKTVIPRARLIIMFILLDDYCIRSVLGPIRRRHSPRMRDYYYWFILYKICLRANSQEAFSKARRA